jgi:SAM-dependent methyltransferase
MTSAGSSTPDFTPLAPTYARARPRYPDELYVWLAAQVDRRELAWDAATGNGQAAVGLARQFDRVVATDISPGQIAHAAPHPKIEFRVAGAEASGLGDGSVDLAAVATALHWLPLERFFAEVRRVVRPGGVFAAWTYHAGTCEPPFDQAIHDFYWRVARPHFGPEVQIVDDLYRTVDFPGERIEAPGFRVEAHWTFAQTLDYLRTWSGVAEHLRRTGVDLVEGFAPQLARLWSDPEATRPFCMPIVLEARRMPGR